MSQFPAQPAQSNSYRDKMKLPQVSLPKFSNKPDENCTNFFTSFESILAKYNLTDHERYALLKDQLSGSALALIKSVDINTSDQYQLAKKLLEEAFGNVDSAKHDVIQRLANLKQRQGIDPYVFIGDLKSIVASFDSLKIEVDDVLTYFVWNSFDKKFQQHLTTITNKNFPSLDEINNNLFDACNRYLTFADEKNSSSYQKPINKSSNITAMAVNVRTREDRKPFCVLCRHDKKPFEHYLQDCSVYKTAKLRFDKLKDIGGCVKCSYANHRSSNCKFKFNSLCQYCGKDHMSYLCLKNSEKPTKEQTKQRKTDDSGNKSGKNENTSASSASVEYAVELTTASSGNPTILPTFTANVRGQNDSCKLRIFKDSGSQKSFVSKEIADKLNFEIVHDDVILTVNGINESKTMHTKVVKLPITLNGSEICLEAFIIDEIRTKFSVPDIHVVVNNFKSKGYRLADEWLLGSKTNMIANIGIILGTNGDAFLPMRTKLFGNDLEKSSYIETDIGVIFAGDIPCMIRNLPLLPTLNAQISCNSNVVTDHKVF